MQSYGQFCPVAQALEIIGERWTLLVIRELLAGSTRFNDLARGVPLMSRSMLAKRLKHLEENRVVERLTDDEGSGVGYRLLPAGDELLTLIEACGIWGQRWARRKLDVEHLDAGLLMWDLRRSLNTELLPTHRTIIEFRLRGGQRGQPRYWLRIEGPEIELCLNHPGFEIDLRVDADLLEFTRVWLGHSTWRKAVRSGAISLQGPRRLCQAFPKWIKLSGFAEVGPG